MLTWSKSYFKWHCILQAPESEGAGDKGEAENGEKKTEKMEGSDEKKVEVIKEEDII